MKTFRNVCLYLASLVVLAVVFSPGIALLIACAVINGWLLQSVAEDNGRNQLVAFIVGALFLWPGLVIYSSIGKPSR